MRILLTGAGGLVGTVVGNKLHELGYDVLGIIHRHKSCGHFPQLYFDLSCEWNFVGDFDVIVHTAGSLPYTKCSLSEYYRNNVVVMEKLIDFTKRQNIKRVINLSTIGVYGDFRDRDITEESDIINPNGYGITKYLAECMLRTELAGRNISLRPPGIIGPGCRGIWFSDTIAKFRHNQPVKIYTPGFKTKNFVWVYDLSDFVIHLINSDNWKYDVLNLACAEADTVMDIVATMKQELGSASEIIADNTIRQPFCLNSDKAFELGYKSLTPTGIVREFCKML